jgi:FkbM family methyltransferase
LYFKPGEPTGIDLKHDLQLLIKGESPVIFDVGANVGQSIELFRSIFPRCHVYAFEPTASCVEVLRNKAFGDCVEIFPMALGDKEEPRMFHEYEESVFNSVLSLDLSDENRFSYVKSVGSSVCLTRTVDLMIKQLGCERVDLLKIDTQGFDMHVLKGAADALQRGTVKVVMVELNFVAMYEGQDSYVSIFSLLSSHQFRLVDFYEKWRQGGPLAWCTAVFSR